MKGRGDRKTAAFYQTRKARRSMEIKLPKEATGTEIVEVLERVASRLNLDFNILTEYRFEPGSVVKVPVKYKAELVKYGVRGKRSILLKRKQGKVWKASFYIGVQELEQLFLVASIPRKEIFLWVNTPNTYRRYLGYNPIKSTRNGLYASVASDVEEIIGALYEEFESHPTAPPLPQPPTPMRP